MGVIKVETFDVSPGANGTTHTLTNDVGSLSDAFVKVNSSTDKGTGPTGSTANANPVDAHSGVQLTATNTLTFNKGSATAVRKMGEVWRYTGPASGVDEFIVRGHLSVTLGSGVASNSVAVTGLVDRNKAVPFLSGQSCDQTSVNDYDAATVAVYIDGSGNLVASRQSTTGSVTVYVSVVEFTGSNWTIGHARSSSHDTSLDTVTLVDDSTGVGGSTVDINNWSTAFIEGSMEGDTAETGLSDNLIIMRPNAATTAVEFFLQQDGNARNDGDAYAHVMSNPGLVVTRNSNTNFAETNGTVGTTTFPSGTSTTETIDELALEWFCDTSGVGTAHARGRLNARITNATGTVSHWVHRSGNNVSVYLGIINLAGISGVIKPIVTDSPAVVDDGSTNLTLTGTNFQASQGAGKVEIWSDQAGTVKSVQTIDSWSDTSIQFDFVRGSITDGNRYIVVTADDAEESSPRAITVGLPSYQDVIETLNPDHRWILDGDYDDTGSVPGTGMNQSVVGTQNFIDEPLCEGVTQCVEFDGADSRREAPDNNEMNLQAESARSMFGWMKVSDIQQTLSMIYKEGGSVNNIAFLRGYGNVLICQLADTGDDNVQVYSDFRLSAEREYLIAFRFDYGDVTPTFEFLIDGVIQARSAGNPLTAPDFDSHSGDITWNDADTSLEVGGTDVTFNGCNNLKMNEWTSFTRKLTDTEMRESAFERGARPTVTISEGATVIADSYADTNQNTTRTFDDGSSAGQPYQTFTGNGGDLAEIRAMVAAPQTASYDTGVYFEIYAHTGTFGSTGEPTGAALATSETRQTFNDLTGTLQMETFTFSGADQITLADGVNYCLVGRGGAFSGLFGTSWGADDSSPTHPGNAGFKDTLAPNNYDATEDLIFEVKTIGTMQQQLDALADTVRPDAPLAIRIDKPLAGGDLTLTADNITFDSRVSIDIQWMGTGELTWIKENGSDVDTTKLSTPAGGTITIVESVPVTFTVQSLSGTPVENARVYITAAAGGPLTEGTVLFNDLTNASGVATFNLNYSSDQPITGTVRKGSSSPFYKTGAVVGTISSSGLDNNIFLILDE